MPTLGKNKDKPPAKTAAERKRKQRAKERQALAEQGLLVPKRPPKTPAERKREQRARQRLRLAQCRSESPDKSLIEWPSDKTSKSSHPLDLSPYLDLVIAHDAKDIMERCPHCNTVLLKDGVSNKNCCPDGVVRPSSPTDLPETNCDKAFRPDNEPQQGS